MSETVNLYQAKTNLSSLVERAVAGEEIIIAKAGSPKVRLVPVQTKRKPREPVNAMGITYIAEDFDDPMPDFEKAFYGED